MMWNNSYPNQNNLQRNFPNQNRFGNAQNNSQMLMRNINNDQHGNLNRMFNPNAFDNQQQFSNTQNVMTGASATSATV